ncbi:MAG: glucosyltransferase domain-containing protein, partial [Lachnospiraceae bacterium]|nr:glucosyltransferase domain-containing protein [Lachnospiraceae bacterium]
MKDENVLKKGIIAIVDSISLSFKDVLERAQKYGKLFAITLAVSVAAYSLLMCNQLVNKLDGVWHGSICYGGRHELSIGRWFWRFLDRFRFYLAPDPVSSVMALVFFILAIILVIDIFEVSKKPYMYAASLTFALNVSVCVCLSFRYMSSVFAIACLLGVFTAYVIIKAKNRIFIYIAAPVSIALMMGLYQAYIGCGTLVILLYLAYELYRDKKEYRELLMFILRTIIVYVIGGILYYVLLQINLVHYEVTMDDYNNASSYGLGPAIMNLPHSFLRIYNDFREYYGQVIMKTNIYEKKIYVVIFALIAIHLLIAIVNLFKRNKLKAVLFTACILLIPIGVDVVLFITYDSFTSVQMTIPLSMC